MPRSVSAISFPKCVPKRMFHREKTLQNLLLGLVNQRAHMCQHKWWLLSSCCDHLFKNDSALGWLSGLYFKSFTTAQPCFWDKVVIDGGQDEGRRGRSWEERNLWARHSFQMESDGRRRGPQKALDSSVGGVRTVKPWTGRRKSRGGIDSGWKARSSVWDTNRCCGFSRGIFRGREPGLDIQAWSSGEKSIEFKVWKC